MQAVLGQSALCKVSPCDGVSLSHSETSRKMASCDDIVDVSLYIQMYLVMECGDGRDGCRED